MVKTDEEGTKAVMAFALELLADIAFACEPFLPFTHEKLCRQLNLLPLEHLVKPFWAEGKMLKAFPAGHHLGEAFLIFTKIEDTDIEKQLNKLEQSKQDNAAAPAAVDAIPVVEAKAEITYDDFAKMDLKVATVLEAEKVEKADKLLKLTLEVGNETRTVVSGIALHYTPEEVKGRQVVLLSNLAPRKMRGIESQGMILMAEDADGKLVFVSPSEAVKSGSGVS